MRLYALLRDHKPALVCLDFKYMHFELISFLLTSSNT